MQLQVDVVGVDEDRVHGLAEGHRQRLRIHIHAGRAVCGTVETTVGLAQSKLEPVVKVLVTGVIGLPFNR